MRKRTGVLIAFVLLMSLSACKKEPSQRPSEQASPQSTAQATEAPTEQVQPGEISAEESKQYLQEHYAQAKIDGSTSMIPLHQSLNRLFGSETEEVTHSKTVEAFEKLIRGENDILLGVDYSDELLETAKDSGVELVKKEITREAFVFLVNKNNPVQSLTVDQIKGIYSGRIVNWAEVGGDDAPIKAYQRNSDSGSQIRMTKFMGNVPLMEKGVEYISNMGFVVEQVGNYEVGQYAIAYNMYTFTEKQYANSEVTLLSVNGIQPDSTTIFEETYPINIFNYLYYDANNAFAAEFADHLYHFLMSDDGQRKISDSGYVNLNKQYYINPGIEKPFENDYSVSLGFYNEEKGEFYDVTYDGKGDGDGALLIFHSFHEYVLRDSRYKDTSNAIEYLTAVFESDIPMNPFTASLYEDKGSITLSPWFDASLDAEDFFNYQYGGLYYSDFTYYIDEDRYVLTAFDKDILGYYQENGDLDAFSEYMSHYEPGAVLEIPKDALKNLYLRTNDIVHTASNGVKLEYYQPFAP